LSLSPARKAGGSPAFLTVPIKNDIPVQVDMAWSRD